MSNQETDVLQGVGTASAALGEIIKTAGKSEEGKEAARYVGKAAVTVAKTLNNCLIPLAAVNFAFDKARNYFQSTFAPDLEKVTSHIPLEHFVEPKPSLAGPALQGLAFSLEEPSLKEMYLELLGASMDGRRGDEAHPAFVDILKQLTSTEAMHLQSLLRLNNHPVIQILKRRSDDRSHYVLRDHVLNWLENGTPTDEPRLPAYISNWVRLGLIDVTYSKWLNDPDNYDWIESRPELASARELVENEEGREIDFNKGIVSITAFGKLFAEATGIRVSPSIHNAQ